MAIDDEVKVLPVMVNAGPDSNFFLEKISKKIQTGPDDGGHYFKDVLWILPKSNGRV